MRYLYIAIAVLFFSENLFSKDVIINKNNTGNIDVSDCISFTIDSLSVLSYFEIEHLDINWERIKGSILNKPISEFPYWCKIEIINDFNNYFLFVDDPLIEFLDVFYVADSGLISQSSSGCLLDYPEREVLINDFCFKLPEGSYTCYIRLEKLTNSQIPMKILSLQNLMEHKKKNNFALGLYFGVLFILLIYISIIFIYQKQRIFLLYFLYLFFLLITNATIEGLTFLYLWPFNPNFNYFLYLYSSITLVFMTLLIMDLLKIRVKLPKYSKIFYMFISIFSIDCLLVFYNRIYSLYILHFSTVIFVVFLLWVGLKSFLITKDRFTLYFICVWNVYIFSIILFLMQVNGYIVSNTFTRNSVLFGSCFEAIMFSFLLMYRVKLLQEEKNEVQIKELNLRIEKQELLEDYAESLEGKVKQAMNEIEKYQSDLVQSEKMNSLALISSGISHEINGAIHLFSSSLSIVKRNFNLLINYVQRYDSIDSDHSEIVEKIEEIRKNGKQENLYETINESYDCLKRAQLGINRTVKIIDSLKHFTRSNANSPLISTSINKDIKSLVTLQKAILPPGIKVDLKLGKLPLIHAKAKDLNQAFLSVFEFAIHAIKSKSIAKGLITIETKLIGNEIIILFGNDGVSLCDEDVQNVFDPFHLGRFVGKRGMGLAAAYRIIKEHGGDIVINTEEGKGTQFRMSLSLN